MRNLKKFLALVLAMVMAFSLMLTANAAVTTNVTYPDDDEVTPQFVEAVEVLSGMGVFHGDEGTFYPSRNITRAEVAAIIYRLVTADINDTQAPLYRNVNHPFTDVTSDKWYAGYVGYLWNAGIVKGDTATTFNPSGNVTGYEALAMILRAVGYDAQNEFSGGNWYQNVASISKNEGILEDVDKTIYAGTLHSPARRDVVASLLFRTAAYVNQVIWTSALSYTKTGMSTNAANSSDRNPTLGYQWFGLTWHWGVVTGNADTGEGNGWTYISFDTDATGVSFTEKVGNGSGAYLTAGTGVTALDTDGDSRADTWGKALSFHWDSSLDQFGHAVKVWYDGTDRSYRDTYYVKDEVVNTKVVAVTGDLDLQATTPATVDLVSNMRGFANTGMTFWNYSFGVTDPTCWEQDGANTRSGAYTSPIKENNSSTDYPLYLLISNSGYLDMVVSLDLTVSQVSQQNDTTNPTTVGVTNANGLGSKYFDVEDSESVGADQSYTNILQSALVGNSTKNLGDKVMAIEVTGTNGGSVLKLGDNADNLEGNYSNNAVNKSLLGSAINSTYYYSLKKLTHVVPGTVIDIDTATQSVTLSDGSVLNQSVFALATDGSFKDRSHVQAPLVYSTYNFTLDAEGNYIFWDEISSTERFVYGTYLDYATPLNSSVYTYSMVGVGMDGKQTIETPIISYTDIHDASVGTKLNSTAAYNSNPLPKRDHTLGSGFVGEGQYVGYTIDVDGSLHAVTGRGDLNRHADSTANPMMMDNGEFFGLGDVSISERDVLIGAKEVGTSATTNQTLFLTNETQFYVVEGAGTDTQKIHAYKGLAELMDNCTSVTIDGDGTSTLTPGSLKAGVDFDQMIYFSMSPFTYAQNYASSAWKVDTVFIPQQAVDRDQKYDSNLVFIGNSSSSIINASGEPATRYTTYNNGVATSYWIKGLVSDGTGSAWTISTLGDNVFYRLKPTSSKAVNGEIIYEIDAVQNANDIIIGQYYDGTTKAITNNRHTSPSAHSYPIAYAATTTNSQVAFIDDQSLIQSGASGADLYHTGNALVKNLSKVTYPGIEDSITSLNAAGSITTNYGVPVSCVLSADSDTTVSFIYVNYLPGN